jgi:hypothetical protein
LVSRAWAAPPTMSAVAATADTHVVRIIEPPCPFARLKCYFVTLSRARA